jgi:O-antigen ligase
MLKRGADMEGRTIHSQYLQIAADSGWIALACYLLMVGITFGSIWQARWRLWNRKDADAKRAIAMLNGVECSLVSFLVGALALSLEVFEPSYLLLLMGAQVWALLNAHDTARGRPRGQPQAIVPRTAPPREPPPQRPAGHRGPSTGKHPFARFQQPTQQR